MLFDSLFTFVILIKPSLSSERAKQDLIPLMTESADMDPVLTSIVQMVLGKGCYFYSFLIWKFVHKSRSHYNVNEFSNTFDHRDIQ